MKAKYLPLLLTTSIISLSGCTDKAPSCSESGTLDLVRQIMVQNSFLTKAEKLDLVPEVLQEVITFSAARALSYQEDANLYHCNVQMTVNNELNYSLDYDSQRLEDGQHYAVINTLFKGGDWYQFSMYLRKGVQEIIGQQGATKADDYQ